MKHTDGLLTAVFVRIPPLNRSIGVKVVPVRSPLGQMAKGFKPKPDLHPRPESNKGVYPCQGKISPDFRPLRHKTHSSDEQGSSSPQAPLGSWRGRGASRPEAI